MQNNLEKLRVIRNITGMSNIQTSDDDIYQVSIEKSGTQFGVRENESVLAAALRQHVMLSYSCRNGTCASCHGKVLTGDVHYPDQPPNALTAEQLDSNEALFCQAVPKSDLTIQAREIDMISDIPVKMLPARVQSKDLLSPTVMRLRLALPKGKRLQFLAGQYLDILLPGGKRRAFSIASAPYFEDYIELHVRHVEGGDFTEYVFKDMQEKAIVRFEGPLGTFFLRENSRPILMMAGGTGFAPLKAMLEDLYFSGFKREVHLFWGARNASELYLHDVAVGWAEKYTNLQYTGVVDEPNEHWQGSNGYVHKALLEQYPDIQNYDVYMSGPPVMIDAARHDFLEAGLPEDQLFYDSFDFAPR